MPRPKQLIIIALVALVTIAAVYRVSALRKVVIG
jgi:hypothetical protein